MARLDVVTPSGKFRLDSEPECWSVGLVKVGKSGKSEGQEYVAGRQYYGTLSAALTSLLDRSLRESDAEGIQEVLDHVLRFRGAMAQQFAITVVEIPR